MRESIGTYLMSVIDAEHLKTDLGWDPKAEERLNQAIVDYFDSNGGEQLFMAKAEGE